MRRNIGIGVAWLAATALSVFIASAAVAGIRDGVVETPVAIGAPTTAPPAAPATTTSSTVADPVATTSTSATPQAPTSTTAAPPQTTTTAPPAATTTTAPAPTTTTAPPTTTTSAVTYQTYTLIGGTVTLSIGNGEVRIASAVANAGFDTDIERNGPRQVEVEFESNDHKSELSAHFENGELEVKTEEEPHGEDGDEDD
jgi:hypothetical protein